MTDTGGPAFPRPYSLETDGCAQWAQNGMTLRDYFAGQALIGLLANHNTSGVNGDACIAAAWRAADAMIRCRVLDTEQGA